MGVPARARLSPLREQAERLAGALPPLLVEAERIAATVAQGVHGRRRSGSGDAFWQFRRYRTEDASTAIDWRQSAKSQHLFVREREWEAAESVWLWRSAAPSMAFASSAAVPQKLTRASVVAIALATLLERGGERIAVLGRPEPPALGRVALRRIAAMLDASRNTEELPPPARLPRFAQVALIGDFLVPHDPIARSIEALAAQGVKGHLLQINDPAEEDFPYEGRTRFELPGVRAAAVFGRAENVREEYRRAFTAHRDALSDVCRQLGWTFATHRTDRPPHLALLALYMAMAATPGHLQAQVGIARKGAA